LPQLQIAMLLEGGEGINRMRLARQRFFLIKPNAPAQPAP